MKDRKSGRKKAQVSGREKDWQSKKAERQKKSEIRRKGRICNFPHSFAWNKFLRSANLMREKRIRITDSSVFFFTSSIFLPLFVSLCHSVARPIIWVFFSPAFSFCDWYFCLWKAKCDLHLVSTKEQRKIANRPYGVKIRKTEAPLFLTVVRRWSFRCQFHGTWGSNNSRKCSSVPEKHRKQSGSFLDDFPTSWTHYSIFLSLSATRSRSSL